MSSFPRRFWGLAITCFIFHQRQGRTWTIAHPVLELLIAVLTVDPGAVLVMALFCSQSTLGLLQITAVCLRALGAVPLAVNPRPSTTEVQPVILRLMMYKVCKP